MLESSTVRTVIQAGLVAVMCGLACCGDSAPRAGQAASTDANDPVLDGLRDELERLLTEVARGNDAAARQRAANLALPDAPVWMTETFGDAGQALAAEYAPLAATLPRFVETARGLVRAGQNAIVVERFTNATDPAATGYQAAALARMQSPVPLFSARFTTRRDGGPPAVFHMWSFVIIDGRFRWIGKLRALAATAPSVDGRDVLELRVRDRAALERRRSNAAQGD